MTIRGQSAISYFVPFNNLTYKMLLFFDFVLNTTKGKKRWQDCTKEKTSRELWHFCDIFNIYTNEYIMYETPPVKLFLHQHHMKYCYLSYVIASEKHEKSDNISFTMPANRICGLKIS